MAATVVFAVWTLPSTVFAHHEALFGPLSAAVMSSDAYVTAQVFSRQLGPASDRTRETTTVLGASAAPFKGRPLSVSITFPFSTLSHGDNARTGLENVILGARYRIGLPRVAQAIGGRESYALAVGGVEVPSGTLDHGFGKGAFASVVAGLMSIEKGNSRLSATASTGGPGRTTTYARRRIYFLAVGLPGRRSTTIDGW
jgi:hypothetical protein